MHRRDQMDSGGGNEPRGWLADPSERVFGLLALVLVHAFVARWCWQNSSSPWTAWLVIGGVGTLAVWFAWTLLPWPQRLARAAVAWLLPVMLLGTLEPNYLRNLWMPQGTLLWGFQGRQEILRSSLNAFLVFWLLGALLSAYLTSWFAGFCMRPPGATYRRQLLSIRALFIVTLVGAVASFGLRGQDWAHRIQQVGYGMTLGFVAAAMAWWQLQPRRWQRLLWLVGGLLLLVLVDLCGGGLLGYWQGQVGRRVQYVVVFVTGVAVSPMVTFSMLRLAGYELVRGGAASHEQA